MRNKRIFLFGSACLLLLWLVLATWISVSGRKTDLRKVDCIIVPGARVEVDGRPGLSLKARLDHAIALWKEGWAPGLLCTGGLGETGYIEGQIAKDYAISCGVPAEAIDFEGSSHDTRANFSFAKPVMERHGWQSCLVVTDPFHEKRCLMLAGDLGIEAYPAPTFDGPGFRRWSSWAFYTCRETVAMAKYAWQRL
jgi:uncharacterized SAM-binding protein YcdF (DUF218 family)